MIELEPSVTVSAERRKVWRQRAALAVMIVLVLCGVIRSAIATRFDAFTIDEAWHITAGVSYVRTDDFRLNPEHPPLVKLWLGAWLRGDVFHLPPFRALQDKPDERDFIDDTIYLKNDADRVQRRARLAMLTLHALLLVALAMTARRVFGDTIAMAALAFLVIDPTVAAHLPVAMTDLPLALLSATAMLLAVVAFRSWRMRDLALVALALGLVLGTKHSGLITMATATIFGGAMAIWSPSDQATNNRHSRWQRLAMVAAVALSAAVILWSFYGFRFNESKAGLDLFNRPLAEKINDLKSPLHREVLFLAARGHLLPRAYLWGLADIIRAGVEGRHIPLYFFGRRYEARTPWYFFPGVLLVKLPLGLLALTVMGAALILGRRIPRALRLPLGAVLGLAAVFLLFLARSNAGYAGVRHALTVFPALAILGALAIKTALEENSRLMRSLAVIAMIAALASALPVVRPWEYYNELVGGAQNAWRYFNDEGLDLGQRTTELARYYDEHIRMTGETPYDEYGMSKEERERRQMRLISAENVDLNSDVMSGTVFLNATWLAPRRVYDYAVFRETQPVARFGNLLVFRGSFRLPWLKASNRLWRAMDLLYSQTPDAATAERLLRESVELYPQAYGAAIELGNRLAKRGARDEAIRAYQIAQTHAPQGDEIIALLERQIERITKEPPEAAPSLRNPWLE
jgi:hypothetical protein